MPKFFHELPEAKKAFETIGHEKDIRPVLVEKDYWIMHCLWGLQQQGFDFEMKGGTSLSKGWGVVDRFSEDIDVSFEAPQGLNVNDTKKDANIQKRFDFFDGLAAKIAIPGITAVRNPKLDDEKAQNGAINLKYAAHFEDSPEVKTEVLLEVGFARTAPNEPRDFSSWAFDKALEANLDVIDNRAPGVKCFNPEYTFVDKLQTISRRYRQHKTRGDERDRPRAFLRHYYDLYMLLGMERVNAFIGTPDYDKYKVEKLKGLDAEAFASKKPFTLVEDGAFALFEKEFASMNTLLLSKGPSFKEVAERLKEYAPKF